MILQSVPVHIPGLVGHGVIIYKTVDIRKIKTGDALLAERQQVSTVRKDAEDLVIERAGAFVGTETRVLAHHPSAAAIGDHKALSGISPPVEIQHGAHLVEQGIVADEAGRSQQPNLFAIGEQKNDIVP